MTEVINNRLFQLSNNISSESSINELIDILKPYMLFVTNKVYVKQDDKIINSPELNIDSIKEETKNNIINNTIAPIQRDTLFWCIYIAIHGYEEYNVIHNNHNTREIESRQELLNKITKDSSKMKLSNHKVTKSNISEILSDLMTSPYKTNILCLIAITVYYNINIVIMNEEKTLRMEFTTPIDDAKTYILYKNDRNNYSIRPEELMEFELDDIRKTSFLIENNEKQIKSIGSYKVDVLVHYAKMFELYNEAEKYKKTDIYNLIREYVTKFTL